MNTGTRHKILLLLGIVTLSGVVHATEANLQVSATILTPTSIHSNYSPVNNTLTISSSSEQNYSLALAYANNQRPLNIRINDQPITARRSQSQFLSLNGNMNLTVVSRPLPDNHSQPVVIINYN